MAERKSTIRDEIIETADYYPPEIYTLLGGYSSLDLSFDTISQDFIPVTSAKGNPKLFVIGLIPPSANVTGKLLDRSASVAATGVATGQNIDVGGGAEAQLRVALSPSSNRRQQEEPAYRIASGTSTSRCATD